MLLKSLEYAQFAGTPGAWRLEGLTLGTVNLVVGLNATGKTRCINAILGIAELLAGDSRPTLRSAEWRLEFDCAGQSLLYTLAIAEAKVLREAFVRDGETLLERAEGGVGTIWAERLGARIDFQTPETEIAALSRRDTIQHAYLQGLHEWGKALHHYRFGSDLGKETYLHAAAARPGRSIARDGDQVVAIFANGRDTHGEAFSDAVRADMERIGYPLESIDLGHTEYAMSGTSPGQALALRVKERSLHGTTDQHAMSQGMFRALSILIQLNYSYLSGSPSCILIDDIGEGLDFERSSALIKLLTEKAEQAAVQLIMSTNDRYIMNNVPLEHWSVLQRESGGCRVYNYRNAKAIFDEFKFTGMNNFDFLATDFLNAGFSADA